MREAREERVAPQTPDGVEPVSLEGSPGATCRPFLTIQKDPERFAACNALADEVGPLNDPKKAFELLEEAIGDEVNEVFGVMTLDLHLRMKSMAETGRGEPTSVMAPIVPTLQAAVADGAQAAIIYHVHPSGIEAQPSEADIETTQAFVEAFDAVGITLLDHVIVGGDIRNRSYYSFAEDNAL
jgi:DNA repair protein RadC